MRWHVAGAARVGVVPPGAADVVALLEDHQAQVSMVAAELDGCGETAEAGSDDRDIDVHGCDVTSE